ncbi:MAG: class I SAM-dependent methyltransferase [Candidatus Omnitrophica bacterium]|nr:class I SAM-dependent methyltransferase [Candidatus Omnitrophota bacterium]
MAETYSIIDTGEYRILKTNLQETKTYYSKKVIDTIIERKGLERALIYLSLKEKRSKFLQPLFDYLHAHGYKNMKVLEIGCSTGHITEYLNEQLCVEEIYTFDIDKKMVEITKIKKEELKLEKVRSIDHIADPNSIQLPYPDNFFDLVIALAVVEHIDYPNRQKHITAYYRKLKPGGLIGFFDTPNRLFPIEVHSTHLPFIQFLEPNTAYYYAKLFGKAKGGKKQFTEPGSGWQGATYSELFPTNLSSPVIDISKETGYHDRDAIFPGQYDIRKTSLKYCTLLIATVCSRLFRIPLTRTAPFLNVVFYKQPDQLKSDIDR